MPQAQSINTIEIAGISIVGTITKTADAQSAREVPLPAGQAGTLTTRTGDTQGTVTLDDTPLVAENDVVDIFWEGGCKTGAAVGIVAGNAVPLDGMGGDNFPVQDTAVIVTERVPINIGFDGDDVEMIAAVADQRAHLDFEDSADAILHAVELAAAKEAWSWIAGQGYTNPLTGNAVDQIQVSNGTVTAATLKLGVLFDSTP